jgi:hypothetical protein
LLRAAHGADAPLLRADLDDLADELRAKQRSVSEIFARFCPAGS